jgi:hypothetical protein
MAGCSLSSDHYPTQAPCKFPTKRSNVYAEKTSLYEIPRSSRNAQDMVRSAPKAIPGLTMIVHSLCVGMWLVSGSDTTPPFDSRGCSSIDYCGKQLLVLQKMSLDVNICPLSEYNTQFGSRCYPNISYDSLPKILIKVLHPLTTV